MDKAYYREYFDLERKHWWFRARAEILMTHLQRMIGSDRNLRILNVGAATGRSSELLRQLGQVTSVEYDWECCAFTRSATGMELLQASITELPFPPNSFDLVCAFDVIEHVENDAAAVRELHRVCSPSGLVSITVPAFMFLWSPHDDVNHHYWRYTKAGLHRLVCEAGIEPVFESYFNFWLFFPIAIFRVLGLILPKKKRADAGSDFFAVQNQTLDKIFYAIFCTEAPLIRSRWRLPVGVSLLSTGTKESKPTN